MSAASESVLKTLRGGVIVSVQADEGEPFYDLNALRAMALSTLAGGACGWRLAGAKNIAHLKQAAPQVPVIGITKPQRVPPNFYDHVYITPSFADVAALASVGTDIIALDATQRPRPNGETLTSILAETRKAYPDILLMADISTFEEGVAAEAAGFDILSTTLAGYTEETRDTTPPGPDFPLLQALVAQTRLPVILEGRIWDPSDVTRAFDSGAYAVVIGSAITRPHLITKRFCQAIPAPRTVAP
jgi:N-acylglucosamine-6-phosphate 2-epimerase